MRSQMRSHMRCYSMTLAPESCACASGMPMIVTFRRHVWPTRIVLRHRPLKLEQEETPCKTAFGEHRRRNATTSHPYDTARGRQKTSRTTIIDTSKREEAARRKKARRPHPDGLGRRRIQRAASADVMERLASIVEMREAQLALGRAKGAELKVKKRGGGGANARS